MKSKKIVYKRIHIPLIDHYLFIYIGKEGYKKLNDKLLRNNLQLPKDSDIECDGLHYENNVYVEKISNRVVFYHELCHYFDWLFSYIHINKESEFKAYIFGVIMNKISRWL